MKNMFTCVLKSAFSWLIGSLLAFILLELVMKIGWADKEKILILGYGAIASIVVFYIEINKQFKKIDMAILNEKINTKAERHDVEILQCKMDLLHSTLEHIEKGQEEAHATIDNIYNILIKQNKQ